MGDEKPWAVSIQLCKIKALDTLEKWRLSRTTYTYQESSGSFWSLSSKHQISHTITFLAHKIILSLKIYQMPGLKANRLGARKPTTVFGKKMKIRVSFQCEHEIFKENALHCWWSCTVCCSVERGGVECSMVVCFNDYMIAKWVGRRWLVQWCSILGLWQFKSLPIVMYPQKLLNPALKSFCINEINTFCNWII